MKKTPKIKKKQATTLIYIVVFIVVFFVIIFLSFRNFWSGLTTDEQRIENESSVARINILSGGPRISETDAFSRTIEDGEGLTENTTITTDSISRAVIATIDNTIYVLDRNTRVQIADEGHLVLDAGRIFTIVFEYSGQFNRNINSENIENIISSGEIMFTKDGESTLNTEVLKGKTIIKSINTNGEASETEVASAEAITIEFNKTYQPSDLSALKSTSSINLEEEFIILQQCITKKANEILTGENHTRSNFIKNRLDEFVDCVGEIKGVEFDTDNTANTSLAANNQNQLINESKKTAPIVNAVSLTPSGTNYKCTWSAMGEEIEGYEYSVGTSQGAINFKNWSKTTDTGATINSSSMEYLSQYFCNVRAVNQYGKSDVVSSSGVLYDNSSGSISITSQPPGTVTGSVTGINVDSEDLIVEIYVRNAEGKYSDGSNLLDTIYWVSATKSPNGSGFTWTSSISFSGDFSGGNV
ncbi:MAG TPA: hypothetical protein VGA67_03550, partial [Candidatus Dojkabacteria bacterium]